MRIRPHGRYRLAVAVIPTLLALECGRPIPTRPLTEASSIRQLSQREAAHGQPVQVRGRVTYIDQARRLMTVQDSSGGVRVNLTTEIPQLGMGQLVDAAGTTQAGTTTGEVRASRVQVVDGSAQLPVPKILSPAALAANPQLDYEWFEVKGTVHGVSQRPNAHPYLAVVTPEGTVEVRGSGGNPSRLARLAGQQVRVRGVAHAVRGARGEVLHLEMWLGDWSGVSRLAPPAPLQEKSGAVLPTLRSVGAIRELGLAEADRGYPVSLVAVITAKYDSGTALYVQDDTGAVYVSGAGDTRKLRAGDRVAIEGSTSRGGFSADVVARQVRRLGVGTMPSPAEVPLPDLSRGGCDTRWIQTEGTVVGIERGVSAWQVDVEEGWRRLAAVIEASEPDLLELGLNARVRFTGVCDAVTDDWGRATGVRVLVPDVRFLQVLAQGLADPFALPVTPIGNLMRVSPTGELQQRVRISGTVSAVPPGSFGMFYLQDDTGGALVHAPRGSVVVGNLLDVVGLTVPRPLPTAVADAEFRVREGRAALKPVLMTAEEAVFGDYDAQLVSVDGVLLAHASLPDFQELTLQSGVIAYTAALDNREPAGRWSGLQTGSLLRLSGVCIIEQVGGKNTRGFRIVLRSAEDVTVLQSASWWTVEHVASVAVGLAVAALLALFWGSMLRERVRQQTAQGLRSAKTLRAVFDGAPDAMLIVNDSSACIDVNPAACDLLGQSMDELLNPPHLVLGSLGLTQFPQARRGTTLIPRTDGKFAEIDYSIRKDFLPERHLLILRDVTEQAQMRERMLLLAHALRCADNCICITDMANRLLYVNQAFLRTYEYEAHELLGQHVSIVRGSRNEADADDILPATLEDGWRGELWNRTKSGREFPISLETSVVRDEQGRMVATVGIARDITERRKAEEAVRDSEERFRSLSNLASEGIMIHVSGVILDANLTFARIFGYDQPEELIGRNGPELLLTPESQARIRQRMERKETGLMEVTCLRKDGSTFAGETDSRRLRYMGHDATLVSMSDITERKRAEAERAQLEQQFHQAQKMESVGRLAGGVAHDFNNLLTVINGYSQMLLSDLKSGDPLREGLEEIHKAGERAAGLTGQLLAYSRTQVLQLRIVDLNQLVEDMRSMLERLVGEDIEVRVALHAEGVTIQADPHQLEQVVMNLVVNARDAMPGVGKLLVETAVVERDESYTRSHPEARAGRYVMLAVSDTGMGMDEETKNRIFEPFFTTKEVGKGTGLGLSMVQGIVVQSGGYVEVYSEKGKGTTFKIYLPAAAEAAADAGKVAAGPALGGEETLLVVEDQAEVRKYTVSVLKRYGYRVIPAENAAEALLLCERERIDLVLTDVIMPNVGGRELAERLEKLQPGIKVLFMSGYIDTVIEHHGVLEEGAKFIQKPFSPEELAGKVRALLAPTVRASRILVADDEAGVRAFLRKVLEHGGYEVTEAADGKQALRQALAGHVDLVITDLIMPEQEGIETIQALRREAPRIGIIAISGAFGGQFLKMAHILGADALLSKPVSAELLLARVAEVLKARQ